jgi:hypothetical protein
MSQHDVRDLKPQSFRILDVLRDVALRVDDDRRARPLVAQEIGRVGETAQVVLLQDHGILLAAFATDRMMASPNRL